MDNNRNRRSLHKSRSIPKPYGFLGVDAKARKETRRELYATDEQFIKVQVYLDKLKKEKEDD